MPVLAGLLAYAAFAHGGFFWAEEAVLGAGLLALALLTMTFPVRDLRWPSVGFALLAAGLLLPAGFAGWPLGTRQGAVTIAIALCSVLVTRMLILQGQRSQMLSVLSLIGASVAGLGLIGLAFHTFPLALNASGLWRASSTLTYANAFGAAMVVTLPAALVLMAARPHPGHRLAAFLMLAGLGASLSRGGVLALILLFGVIAGLGGRELLKGLSGLLIAVVVAVAGLIPSIAGGPSPLPGIAGLVLGSVIAMGWWRRSPRGALRRWWLLVVVAALLGAGLLVGAGHASLLASRVDLGSEARFGTWRDAVDAGMSEPAFGVGPGEFRSVYVAEGLPAATAFAHNEFLQTFAETGLVGMVAVLVSLACFAAWAFRRRTASSDRLVWAASVGCCAAFLGQSTLDLLWRFPVLVVTVFVWLTVAAIHPQEGREGSGT
ncbi:MAG TPA: O-antigen ligase family protein [Actinomycetota bacterium]|nr:O-antigen ligase family protein [Actinomycetota bacterium]